MKYVVVALLLLATVPAYAAKEERPMSPVPPAAVVAPPTTGYMTFPLDTGKNNVASGCLWRLPVFSEDGLEVYAALSTVRTGPQTEAALQVAGSVEKDDKKQVASFSDIRLTAGPSFDTETIAATRESGPTARIAFPGVHSMALVTALGEHDGKLFFTHDGKKHEAALSRPTADDMAQISLCLTQLQEPAENKAAK